MHARGKFILAQPGPHFVLECRADSFCSLFGIIVRYSRKCLENTSHNLREHNHSILLTRANSRPPVKRDKAGHITLGVPIALDKSSLDFLQSLPLGDAEPRLKKPQYRPFELNLATGHRLLHHLELWNACFLLLRWKQQQGKLSLLCNIWEMIYLIKRTEAWCRCSNS